MIGRLVPFSVFFGKLDRKFTFASTSDSVEHRDRALVVRINDQMVFHVLENILAAGKERVRRSWHQPVGIA